MGGLYEMPFFWTSWRRYILKLGKKKTSNIGRMNNKDVAEKEDSEGGNEELCDKSTPLG